MHITETLNSGLKREIKVRIPASVLEENLTKRLSDLQQKARIKGFRPGKTPLSYLRKTHGQSLMLEIINETLSSSINTILAQRSETPAMQPNVSVPDSQNALAGKTDFEFSFSYEVVPSFTLGDLTQIKITRSVYEITQEDIEEEIANLSESWASFEPSNKKIEEEDQVTVSYTTLLDGVPLQAGPVFNAKLIAGADFIDHGFEDRLIGLKKGDKKDLKIIIPKDFHRKDYVGREVLFSVDIVEVEKKIIPDLTDEIIQKMGFSSLEALKENVRLRMEEEKSLIIRQKLKRQILDHLDNQHKFEVPSNLLESEFSVIWRDLLADLKKEERTFEDENTTEEKVKEEYKQLAERRVRLGLILSQIGKKESISVAEDDVRNALMNFVGRYPPEQQKQVFENLVSDENSLTALRAAVFEEKVVEYLLGCVVITDKLVSRDELMDEEEDQDQDQDQEEDLNPDSVSQEKKKSSFKSSKKSDLKSDSSSEKAKKTEIPSEKKETKKTKPPIDVKKQAASKTSSKNKKV